MMKTEQCTIQTWGTIDSEQYLKKCVEIYCIKCAIPMCECSADKVYCCHCKGCIDLLKNWTNKTVKLIKIAERKLGIRK